MTESLNNDPSADEVCQDWLEQALIETREARFTTEELNIYFEAHAPDAVLDYLIRAMVEGKSTEVGLVPKSIGANLDDYLSNTN